MWVTNRSHGLTLASECECTHLAERLEDRGDVGQQLRVFMTRRRAPLVNGGELFQVVRIHGVAHAVFASGYCMSSESFELRPYTPRADDQLVKVPDVDPRCYAMVHAYAGGLGTHRRWSVPQCLNDLGTPKRFMAYVERGQRGALAAVLNRLQHEQVIEQAGELVCEGDFVACVLELQASHFAYAAACLLACGVGFDPGEESLVTYLCEKLDRADGMWVLQCQEDATRAGPLRRGVHWNLNFQPPGEMLFTWTALARRVCGDLHFEERAFMRYPEPLRTHMRRFMCSEHASRAEALRVVEEAPGPRLVRLAAALRQSAARGGAGTVEAAREFRDRAQRVVRAIAVPEEPTPIARREEELFRHAAVCEEEDGEIFMSKLSPMQEEQLLGANWFFNIGPSEHDADVHRVVLMAYFTFGFMVRAVADYRATGKHVGRSESIRPLARPEYRRERLSTEVINRTLCPDGKLRGTGWRGSKGKHARTRGLPAYTPRKRNKVVESQTLKRVTKPVPQPRPGSE